MVSERDLCVFIYFLGALPGLVVIADSQNYRCSLLRLFGARGGVGGLASEAGREVASRFAARLVGLCGGDVVRHASDGVYIDDGASDECGGSH